MVRLSYMVHFHIQRSERYMSTQNKEKKPEVKYLREYRIMKMWFPHQNNLHCTIVRFDLSNKKIFKLFIDVIYVSSTVSDHFSV